MAHFDVVGSFLRPESLKQVRASFKKGELSEGKFDEIKKNAIRSLVEKQKEIGLSYITDGEYNHKFWHLDFFWGFGDVKHRKEGGEVPFNGEIADLEDSYIAGKVFAKGNVNRLYLEYDDKRSGGFAPLAKVGPDKKVVFGLITTKRPQLEDENAVIARIHEASKYIPLERLYLSSQCGFVSCKIGNKLTEEEEFKKSPW